MLARFQHSDIRSARSKAPASEADEAPSVMRPRKGRGSGEGGGGAAQSPQAPDMVWPTRECRPGDAARCRAGAPGAGL